MSHFLINHIALSDGSCCGRGGGGLRGGGAGAWMARVKGSAGQEVSWKYLLFLREIALAVYQRHSIQGLKKASLINVHSFIVEVKFRWRPGRRGGCPTPNLPPPPPQGSGVVRIFRNLSKMVP